MAAWLSKIGRTSARHPWVVIVTWAVVLFAVAVSATLFAKPLTNSYSVSGLSSLSTLSKADREFGGTSNGGQIVFAAPKGQKLTAADAATVHQLATTVAGLDGVTNAADPFTTQPPTISPDERVGYLGVGLKSDAPPAATSTKITQAIASAHRTDGHLQLAVGSDLVAVPDGGSTEGIAILIGFFVLFVTFGSLLAAGLPLVTAIIGLGVSLEAVSLATSFTSLNSIATVLATLLGLAVGIDYSLFIVNRHRRQVKEGMDVRESIAVATATAGSAVLFAAVTVIIALVGLAVIRIGFLTQMGLAGALAVFVALLMSLTLTPALLRLIGPRVLSRRARRRLAPGTAAATPNGLATRWITLVTRRPVFVVAASVVILGAIALPAVTMRTALPNDGEYPTSTSARQAFDLKAAGFGKGVNAPIEVLATYAQEPTQTEITALASHLGAMTNIEIAIPSGVEGHDALITVLPKSGPGDDATGGLVTTLRDSSTAGLSGSPALAVTGLTAVDIDISRQVSSAFPIYLGVIVVFAFLLLLIVFRSILVPLKATVGFLLSLVATLGGVVAVFQWGWLGGVFHLTPSPLLSFLPVIVTGVLFGLSMDYEMFLVSGMREEIARGAEPRAALTRGFSGAAGVVIAAGVIMISVFGSGAFDSDPTSQAIAFALALGVVLDVFLVRMMFVPAVLALLGHAAWWFPSRLERALPSIDVEGASLAREPARG